MDNEEVVIPTSQDMGEDGVTDPNAVEDEGLSDGDDLDELRTQLSKANELANNYKIRAEKAEKAARSSATQVAPQQAKSEPQLGTVDMLALVKSNINPEDINEVMEYAKFKGISVSEAIKSSFVSNLVKEKEEFRATAKATSSGTSRRVSQTTTDEMLLAKARRGEFSDSDEDIARLYRIKHGIK